MINLLKNYINKFIPKKYLTTPSINSACKTINGSYQVSHCTISEILKINGAASFGQNTTIEHTITVNGSLYAFKTIFIADLFANGTITFIKTLLKNDAFIRGSLTATECTFSHNINLITQESTFINCRINQIIIENIPYLGKIQTIHLRAGSIVNGDIVFNSGNGQIYLYNSSLIKGRVKGGNIVVN